MGERISLEKVEFYESIKTDGNPRPYISRVKWSVSPEEFFESLKDKGILIQMKEDEPTALNPRSPFPEFLTYELVLEEIAEECRGIISKFSIDNEGIYTKRRNSHHITQSYLDFLPSSIREMAMRSSTPVTVHSKGHRKLGDQRIECICEHVHIHFLHHGDYFLIESIPKIKEK